MGFIEDILNSFQDIWPNISQVACCSISASCEKRMFGKRVYCSQCGFCCFWSIVIKVWMWHCQVFWCCGTHGIQQRVLQGMLLLFSASVYFFLYNRLGWLIVYQLIVSLYPLNDYIYVHNNTSNAAAFFIFIFRIVLPFRNVLNGQSLKYSTLNLIPVYFNLIQHLFILERSLRGVPHLQWHLVSSKNKEKTTTKRHSQTKGNATVIWWSH